MSNVTPIRSAIYNNYEEVIYADHLDELLHYYLSEKAKKLKNEQEVKIAVFEHEKPHWSEERWEADVVMTADRFNTYLVSCIEHWIYYFKPKKIDLLEGIENAIVEIIECHHPNKDVEDSYKDVDLLCDMLKDTLGFKDRRKKRRISQ